MSHAANNAKELKVVLERDLGRVVGWVKENHLKLGTRSRVYQGDDGWRADIKESDGEMPRCVDC